MSLLYIGEYYNFLGDCYSQLPLIDLKILYSLCTMHIYDPLSNLKSQQILTLMDSFN